MCTCEFLFDIVMPELELESTTLNLSFSVGEGWGYWLIFVNMFSQCRSPFSMIAFPYAIFFLNIKNNCRFPYAAYWRFFSIYKQPAVSLWQHTGYFFSQYSFLFVSHPLAYWLIFFSMIVLTMAKKIGATAHAFDATQCIERFTQSIRIDRKL